MVEATFAHTLEHGERVARAAVREIPNGVYVAEDVIDGDGHTDDLIPIKVTVTVEDESVHADFAGTSPQGAWPDQLLARRLAVGLQDRDARDHRSAGQVERRLLCPVHAHDPRRDGVQCATACPDELVLRRRLLRERPLLEGAGAGRARATRGRLLHEPLRGLPDGDRSRER